MGLLARIMFGLVDLAARRGLSEPAAEGDKHRSRQRARRTGIRGETFAYWYLRRRGYVMLARDYGAAGIKGDIDLVGYDGPVLAFVEVKARTADRPSAAKPEEAVDGQKRRRLARLARHFLAERRIRDAVCRFDVLAIENRPGHPPEVRLHKGAFTGER